LFEDRPLPVPAQGPAAVVVDLQGHGRLEAGGLEAVVHPTCPRVEADDSTHGGGVYHAGPTVTRRAARTGPSPASSPAPARPAAASASPPGPAPCGPRRARPSPRPASRRRRRSAREAAP